MRGRLTALFLMLTFLPYAAGAAAQEKAPLAPINLSLQVLIGKSPVPSYTPLGPPGTSWYNTYPRIPSWKEPKGTLPFRAVVLAHRREGDQAVVGVTIRRGKKFYDKTEFVAEHRAGLGETVTVGELAKFGFEPFSFKVVRREKVSIREIGVANLTHSIEVVSAEITDNKLIGVRLVLRNLSWKKVMGLKLDTRNEGRGGTIAWPLSTGGRILIEPGGEYEYILGFDGLGEEVAGGYVPEMPETVTVSSVLFADGSYEGELQPAANNAGNLAGYRLQLTRVLDLIRQSLASPDVNTPEAVSRLREEVCALSREADSPVVEEVSASYPGLNEKERAALRDSVEVAMNWVRQEVLAALTSLEHQAASRKNSPRFREWLEERQKFFDKWLASLTP